MSALLMIALVSVVFVGGVIAFNMGVGYKMILVGAVLIIGGFGLYVSHECGPNSADVKVMKPLGNAINHYLTTKGKPTSLDSIPNLPYKLTCGSPYSCRFEGKYRVEFRRWSPSIYSLNISQSEKYHTGILYNYRYTNKRFEQKETKYYSNKTTGICNPMRQ